MQLLATIKPEDVDGDSPSFDYKAFGPRIAARAIVFDDKKIALIYISEHNYYMLPGGGVDEDDLRTGLVREILEELGCEIDITGEVGSTDVYIDRWQKRQTDYCYTARKAGGSKVTAPTDFEIEEGHEVVWASSLKEAIKLVGSAKPKNRDGKLVRARDLVFLESVQHMRL